jgi:hypothetical protein
MGISMSNYEQESQVLQLTGIEKYKKLAIDEQIRSGVPAAITLAQGIHEAAAGTSELAIEANNHFGIKCKSTWTGMTYLHDDDAKQECFRKYSSAEQSYTDHSDFLRKNNRYSALFELEMTDYIGWATELKRAGYATNPAYVKRLTDIIEKYNLQFDPNQVNGEDYDFWVRLSQYCKISNFPEMLVRKRDHPRNITNQYSQSMSETCTRVKQIQFRKMGIELSQTQTDIYTRFADPEWHFNEVEFNILEELLNNIIIANDKSAFVPIDEFRAYISEKWFHLCYQNKNIKNQGFKRFHEAPFSKYFNLNTVSKLKFRVKSAFTK